MLAPQHIARWHLGRQEPCFPCAAWLFFFLILFLKCPTEPIRIAKQYRQEARAAAAYKLRTGRELRQRTEKVGAANALSSRRTYRQDKQTPPKKSEGVNVLTTPPSTTEARPFSTKNALMKSPFPPHFSDIEDILFRMHLKALPTNPN